MMFSPPAPKDFQTLFPFLYSCFTDFSEHTKVPEQTGFGARKCPSDEPAKCPVRRCPAARACPGERPSSSPQLVARLQSCSSHAISWPALWDEPAPPSPAPGCCPRGWASRGGEMAFPGARAARLSCCSWCWPLADDEQRTRGAGGAC